MSEKEIEVEELKKIISEHFNLNIISYWLPDISEYVDKECIFLNVKLSEEILSDYKKYSQLELDIYLYVKEKIDSSKYFDMIAII